MSQTNLPFLPGYRVDVNPKQSHHKTHLFEVQNGVRVDINRDAPLVDSRSLGSSLHPLTITPVPKDYKDAVDSKRATPEATMSVLPSWIAYDRKVLRFYGYFKEAIHASNVENWRVRKCVVYFYLEDDSMHIAEPKVENSGIPQGVFVKRHRIPKSNNQYFGIPDLFIGSELAIYGRVFRLIDCDPFTREFYSANGMELSQPEDYPVDPFTKKQTTHTTTHHKLMNPLKIFMEASLGKPINDVEATKKFLQNDGKVLRFYCTWTDTKLYGETKPYILHYFLADDTVEVLEILQPNSGRDPFPSLLRRQKLPKNFTDDGPDVSRIGAHEDGQVRFYTEADFRVGEYVDVYGRKLFICGADRFTENYYIQNYNLSPDDFPRLNMEEEEAPRAKLLPPPYQGYGTEEDSLGSFLYLMPKVPKPDFKKFMEKDGINIRFLAKFVDPKKTDAERRFIVTFYLNNDTLGVFEKPERNSGFLGGKFLERSRLKNPATDKYFEAADFYVGARITVNKFSFDLIECDEYTRKYINNHPEIWREGLNATNQGNELSQMSTGEIQSYQQLDQSQQQLSSSLQQTLPRTTQFSR